MFSSTQHPSYQRGRALYWKKDKPVLVGEDVFAWQSLVFALGEFVSVDGRFGADTYVSTINVQERFGLEADGIVGPKTRAAAVDHVARSARNKFELPIGALFGQLSHESGLDPGIYSWIIRPGGYYDAGVAQLNTSLHSPRLAFDAPKAIDFLARTIRSYFDAFRGVSTARRWDLAQGAWNAPAFASYYARIEGAAGVSAASTLKPSATAATTFQAYIDSVTAYRR